MQTILITLFLILWLASGSAPVRAESEPGPEAGAGEADTSTPETTGTTVQEDAALDPYVITPEQKARLDAERESGRRHAGPDADTDIPPVEEVTVPESNDGTPAATGARLHPLIRSFVESRYGREHCSAPTHCDRLVELQCLNTGDGPIYYYNNDNGRLLMTCGRACLDPDPYDERDCKKCPYTPWVDCQERAWREEQKRLQQARQEEIEQLQAEEAERQAREAEILRRISEIEQDCNTRIRELQRELDTLQ
ncbi:V-type proton ATPase subunit G [Thiohalobacter thiocyanaticus]|uniref:Uncharacterized protein n=1 Tax=Thiohalobacter thiocyanaticus TaxID=585455 RepID=A0A426QFR1_9GAMM|nr:hypothetical protein [Thiohalobacter thiocyanaticus]RRQ20585.1 hypothetical protein D6C00_00360 [Thiohalobacter thiocyanaticus]